MYLSQHSITASSLSEPPGCAIYSTPLLFALSILSLKGKNRGQFEKKLRNKINKVLKGFDYRLFDDLSKLYVLINPQNLDEVTDKLKKVFGIVGLNQSAKVERNDEFVKEKVLEFANYA